jgi:hypothetical protein
MINHNAHTNDMDAKPRQDLKNSFKLLFKSYKPFLMMQLFSILLTLITFFIIIGVGFVYREIFNRTLDEPVRYILGAFIIIFSGFNTVYLSTTNGLAIDLIDSGDEFTEFRNSFKYLAKFGWQYLLISIIFFGVPHAIQAVISGRTIFFHQQTPPLVRWDRYMIYEAIGLIISYFWYSLFMFIYPSLTVQGKLKHAFVENFRIFKADPKRVFGTWGLFFLVFQVTTYIFGSLTLIFHSISSYSILFGIFWSIFMLLNLFIGTPLQYVVAAGMYFNIEFERFKPID